MEAEKSAAPAERLDQFEEVEDDASSIRSAARGDDLPEGYFYSIEVLGAVAGFCLSTVSAFIFLLFPTNVLTYINADIGPSPYIAWVNIARTLALSFTYTILGRLSDLFGRRWFFIGGNVVALVGIIVCSAAQNVNSLIIGSAIYGLGETVQLSFNVAVARAMLQNLNMGWRWCYYLNIIVVALAIVLLFFFYHPPTFDLLHERKTKLQMLKQLDYVGIFLWTAGLTLLLLGVSLGGTIYPWNSATIISSIVIGVALLIALFTYEAFAKLEYPAIPVQFFANRGFISLVACATVATMSYYSAVLLWPQQVKALYTMDITYGGWVSCTVASATALGQAFGGFFVKWGGNVRNWIIFSTFSMVAFVGACASLTPDTLNAGIAFTMIGPFFVGVIEVCALALAPLFCRPVDIGLASGLLASIRSAGGSIAVSVYSSILSNRLATTVPANVGPAAVAAGLSEDNVPALVASILKSKLGSFPGLTPEIQAAVTSALPTAYSQAFKTVYLASLGFGAIAIVGCLFSKDAQKHLTDKVQRKMNGKRIELKWLYRHGFQIGFVLCLV
ncbi:trichothecene efflux pump [Annulohypoxylon bovei var. microspora]|nr:trichothecene efflux pump [Annulohypoxylon bovei var. microspora]